jgi:hypothetical protein
MKKCFVESVWPLSPFVISRDAAIQERDAAIQERDAAIQERDAAILVGQPSHKDRELTGDPDARKPKLFSHENVWTWLGTVANNANIKVLEIGSREVASASSWKQVIPLANYTGFDYLPGKNVNVVGDAHKLSSYFPESEFDIVISLAVFEHLAMPWIIAEEISKVLKIGGLVGVETHFSFGEHEMPWHFFQFNSEALKVLFNKSLGFEVLDAGMTNSMVGRFSVDASEYLVGKPIGGLYCHSSILAKKTLHVLRKNSPPFDWRSLIDKITLESSYPAGTGLSKRSADEA